MLTPIKKILSGIVEGIIAAKQYNSAKQINNYMSQSVDRVDLKKREEDLKSKGIL